MKRGKQSGGVVGVTTPDTFRDYHSQVRRSLNAVISAHALTCDINDIIAPACAVFDTVCNYDAGTPEPDIDLRVSDAHAPLAALLSGSTEAAADAVVKVRPFLAPYRVEAPAPPPAAAAPTRSTQPSSSSQSKGAVESAAAGEPSKKQHRKERNTTESNGTAATVAPTAQLPSGLLHTPAATPRQFLAAAPKIVTYTPRPARCVVIVNLPTDFNNQPALVNLVYFHTQKTVRVLLPGFPDATSAFVRLPSPQDGYKLIALGSRLVDGYPAIVARPPSLTETNEANDRICAPIREVEAMAQKALAAVAARFAAAEEAADTPAPVLASAATEAELGQCRTSYQTFKTELELLNALGPMADAARKLEVLATMKRLLEQIKGLEIQLLQQKAVEAMMQPVAPPKPSQPIKRYSSSAAAVGDSAALVYIGPFVEPLHDEALLALLGPLPLIPRRIWRDKGVAGSNDVCVEASSAAEVGYLLDQFLYPAWGKFCGYTFSRKPITPAVVATVGSSTAAAVAVGSGGDVQSAAAAAEEGGGEAEEEAAAAASPQE